MLMIPDHLHAGIDAQIDASLDAIRRRAGSTELLQALTAAMRSAVSGGKRVRPHLVVASFLAFGADPDECPHLLPVAGAFELLHGAFVIHDDLIDHDLTRRGVPNVAGQFRLRGRARGAEPAGAALLGDAAAILAGDLLLHEATVIIARMPEDSIRERLLDVLSHAVLVSAGGELADVENAVLPEIGSAQDLLTTAHDKTAVYSFTAPLIAGAVLAGASSAETRELERLGGKLGLAFQLVDDLIGAFGTEQQAGKDAGSDLRETKRTPLIAMARESSSWPQVTTALALAPTGPIAVRSAQKALEHSGARLRMQQLVQERLHDVRAGAEDASLPGAAVGLIRRLADLIERRMP
ncbi:polyprenyl synthetase family protein [Microbacterium sediminicola]|uniref:Polyprenyl synthetase family protein n=1 Tax=Microbacterium sediminicola TaxID=415210 RepID=A0ABN2HN60_9MICO